jgi:diguanylate cyclase (GGDEF)-like protein
MLTLDSSAVFREVLEHLPTAVYFVDAEEKIRFWNDGAEKITGYLRQDVVGRFCRENILSTRTPGVVEHSAPAQPLPAEQALPHAGDTATPVSPSPFLKALRDGHVSEAEMFLHHHDGHRIPVRLRAIPIRDDNGTVIGVVETFDASIGNTDWDRRLNRLSRYGALDEPTGVLSASVMQTQLQKGLEMFEKHRLPLSILLVEIKQFEQLINKFGPLVVSAALRATAQTIESFIRPSDFIGRWDEYRLLVILTECSPFELPAVINKLKTRAGPIELRWWGDYMALALSLGGASAQHGDTPEPLLARAAKLLEGAA